MTVLKETRRGARGLVERVATLEAAVGLIESSKTGREVALTHQVEMDPDYDVVHRVEPEQVVQLG